jgi:hypothetical protein
MPTICMAVEFLVPTFPKTFMNNAATLLFRKSPKQLEEAG